MRLKQVAVPLFFIVFLGFPAHGQVVAVWADGNGNWSNRENWSACFPDACPIVPNNGAGITYDVVIPNGTVTFDASGTVVSTLALYTTLQDNGHSQTLTVGNLFTGQVEGATINWGNHSTLIVTGSMEGGYQSDTNIYGGSLLSIGGNYTGSDFGPGLGLSNSTLRVRGNFQNGAYEGNNFFLGGSTAVIGGEFSSTDGASVFLSASSLTVGGSFDAVNGVQSTIKDGSTVIVGGAIAVSSGELDIDKSSSVTVSGDFVINHSEIFGFGGGGNLDGTLLVKGDLINTGEFRGQNQVEIGGLSSFHAVQNINGFMTVNGTLEVNGGGFNNTDGSLTISGVTSVTGEFTSPGGSVTLNPAATLRVTGGFSNSGGSVILNPAATLAVAEPHFPEWRSLYLR